MSKYFANDSYPDVATANAYSDSKNAFRHRWDDQLWDNNNLHLHLGDAPEVQLRGAAKSNFQQFVCDDVGVPAVMNKSGSSDPRFKRVITSGVEEDGGSEMRKFKEPPTKITSSGEDDNVPGGDPVSFIKNPKIPNFLPRKNSQNPQNASRSQNDPTSIESHAGSAHIYRGSNRVTSRDSPFGPRHGASRHKIAAEKPSCDQHARWQQARKSLSDCTLQTKNTPGDEDGNEDFTARLHSFTSATRLSKVSRWIREYRPTPEKRRSVITVIGQTQGKSFSTVLSEINQRRKLAKELDRHALCETILLSSDREKELKNLIAKVDLVSPDGKLIYSARKVYGYRDNSNFDSSKSVKCEERLCNNAEPARTGGTQCKTNVHIAERDVSSNQARKRKYKRGNKKCDALRKTDVEGVLRSLLDSMRSQFAVTVGVLVLAAMLGVAFYFVRERKIANFLTILKPKSNSWYDQLFR